MGYHFVKITGTIMITGMTIGGITSNNIDIEKEEQQ